MQNYRFGEVVLLAFPFSSRREAKRRPALVLIDTGNADILVARITSQDVDTDYDVRLTEWEQAGLLLPSVVRLHKLATLQKALVERQLGTLTLKDLSKVRAKLQQIFASV
ncbi:MAG: type II toxin-antitoxin system PemK/MazF family toxin [Halobacteriota archaeon]